MSCFDKKIEPIKNKNGINTVISTIELEDKFKEFLNKKSIPKNRLINIHILKNFLDLNQNIKETKESINKQISDNKNTLQINISLYNFIFNENYSSNFYIEYFIYRIKNLNPNCFIERKPGKNIDSKEIFIYNNEAKTEIIYKFLISYGLRNIQNIVRMIKSNNIKYDYIELMACPGGCINGAGQIRVEKTRDNIFNEINNGFNYFKEGKSDIEKSINDIEKIVTEFDIDKNKFKQTFKEADFSKSDLDW
jgi:iron only hydrogenase large subunit-like protein